MIAVDGVCDALQALDGLRSGQAQTHERAAAGGRLGGDAAALLDGHLAHDRQAQPEPGWPRASAPR